MGEAERALVRAGDGNGGVELDARGRIVDVVDPAVSRPDTPEERVRQGYARILLEEYGYPRDRIAINPLVRIGSENRFADIVVYRTKAACATKDQGKAELIVETKAPTKAMGRAQLMSYVFASSAAGGVWTDGREVGYFRRTQDQGQELTEWTNIPRHGETWDAVGHYRKSQLRPPVNLKQVFQRCHNAIYREGLDSEDVALDMVRIILAKYRDEQNAGDLCAFRCTPEEYSTDEGRRAVADRVHGLFKQVVSDHPGVFGPGEEITIGNANLAMVVSELQPFAFISDHDAEQIYDVIGTAFEVYVATHLKGERGQYFTNRLVVEMMVRILDPDSTDVVLDPACGSGGFLISALRHVRLKVLTSDRTSTAKAREIARAAARLFGTDVSPKLVRVAKTNMILNGDGHGGIVHQNALGSPTEELPVAHPLHPDVGPPLRATIVFTNPPFGAGHEQRQRSAEVLRRFDLGRVWRARGTDGWLKPTEQLNSGEGVPPEILFLERCLQALRPGGRLAIVIARGVLDNTNTLAARQYALTHARLLGVINCHPNTFAPFNGTKASILILEKKATPGFEHDEDYPLFMAVSQSVGQDSQGREIYKRDAQGELILRSGRPELDHDLDRLAEAWRQFRRGEAIEYEGAWSVRLGQVMASELRMNPVRYAPVAEQALAQVLELADSPDWEVERLGDFARVFGGPRFKRPFADEGVTDGPSIRLMYTPKAFFERRGESAKYLDLAKASRTQKRQLETLELHPGWILIVDSGTAGKLLGRVGMTTQEHAGTIGNNNLIRIVIDDPVRRDYVYQFLRSELGQRLILRNVYGTNQDHVEPDDVKNIPVPIPRDVSEIFAVHETVREVMVLRDRATLLDARAHEELDDVLRRAIDAGA